MPSVFTDMGAGDFDLTITTPADWTLYTAALPNGDNAVSLFTSLGQNAVWPGEEFCLPNGSGTEARTLEAWVNFTFTTGERFVATVRANSTATSGSSFHWQVYVSSAEAVVANWLNTSAGDYMTVGTASQSSGWHHIVVIWRCGSSRSMEIYIDAVSAGTTSSTSGTPTYATSDAYQFYLGSNRFNSSGDMTDQIAKVAWYSRELTSGEINDHYLAMTT